MRIVDYTDDTGRKWRVQLPDDVGDEDAALGVPIGPPDLAPLGLPEPLALRLHNALFERGLLTYQDMLKRNREIIAVWQAALNADAMSLMKLYTNET